MEKLILLSLFSIRYIFQLSIVGKLEINGDIKWTYLNYYFIY